MRETKAAAFVEVGDTILRDVPGSEARLWVVRSVSSDRWTGGLSMVLDSCDQATDPIPRALVVGALDDVICMVEKPCACGVPADLMIDDQVEVCFDCAITEHEVSDEDLFGGPYADEFVEYLENERNDVDGDELRIVLYDREAS